MIRTTGDGHALPNLRLEVHDGPTLISLGRDIMDLLESVEVHQVWDGADQIVLTFRCWDEHEGRFVLVGEEILAPGTSIVLRAGYGQALNVIGRYDIVAHEPRFSSTSFPTLTVTGFDGFARYTDNQWPGNYGTSPTYTDAALTFSRKYGHGLCADLSGLIPHEKTTRDVRVGKRPDGTTIYKKKDVFTTVVKNAGDNDAKLIKGLAGLARFIHPKVRWIDPGSPLGKLVKRLYPFTEGIDGRDVLFFREANLQRQIVEAGGRPFMFRAVRPDGETDALDSFDPALETKDVPMAVRVTGIVMGPIKELVTVEAEVVGAAQLRERASLLRRAQRTNDATQKAEFEEKAESLSGQIAITKTTRQRYSKLRKRRQKTFGKVFQNAGDALIETLENERRPGMEYDPRKGERVQTMKREVLRATVVANTHSDLAALAMGWLEARLQLLMTAHAMLSNAAGIETVYPQQVHEFRSLPGEYGGLYMVNTARHLWARDGTHNVALSLQRVAEVSTGTRVAGLPPL